MKLPEIVSEPKRSSYDVVVVGGAMMGSSTAWWLSNNPDFDGSILVVERDTTYEFASTSHTNSCIRQQFSNATNIAMAPPSTEYIEGSDGTIVSGDFANPTTEYTANGEWVSEPYMPSPFTESAPAPAPASTVTSGPVPMPQPDYELPPASAPMSGIPPTPGGQPQGSAPISTQQQPVPKVTSSQDGIDAF